MAGRGEAGGMHGGGGACMAEGCMHGRGYAWQGVCMAWGHVWQGACIADTTRHGQ